jgi:hypothetical protein
MENAGVNISGVIVVWGVTLAAVLAVMEIRVYRRLRTIRTRMHTRERLFGAMIEQGQTWRNN